MTIRKKIISASVLMLSSFLVMCVVNTVGNNSVINKITTANELQKETMHLQGIFRGINEFIIDEGEPLSVESTNRHLQEFEKIHGNLKNNREDTGLEAALKRKIDPQWKTVKSGVESFLNIKYVSVEDDAAMLRYGTLTVGAHRLLQDVEALASEMEHIAKASSKKIQALTNMIALVIVSIISILLFTLYRSISTPLKRLNVMAERFGSGDLSFVSRESGNDEFAMLARHFSNAAARLSEMIASVKKVSGELMAGSEELSVSVQQITGNANEQSGQMHHAAASMEELFNSFISTARSAIDAAGSAKEAAQRAERGLKVVTDTIGGMNRISESVNESAGTIEALGGRSEQIGDIVKVIRDIADQTNLLALNAAIEAARAGVHGRGFAVVADEVRELAERTTSATNEIKTRITGILEDTQRAVSSMKNGTHEVVRGVRLANQAEESLELIVSSVQKVTDMVHDVARAAEEQSSTGEQITRNVESVAVLAEHTTDKAHTSSDTTHNMISLVRRLNGLISEFRLRECTDDPPDNNPHDPDNERYNPVINSNNVSIKVERM